MIFDTLINQMKFSGQISIDRVLTSGVLARRMSGGPARHLYGGPVRRLSGGISRLGRACQPVVRLIYPPFLWRDGGMFLVKVAAIKRNANQSSLRVKGFYDSFI